MFMRTRIMCGRFLLWKLSLQSELSSAYVSVHKHCCPCALAALPLVKSCNGRCFRPTIVHIVFVILYIFKTLSLCGFAVLMFYWSAWRPECLLDSNSCSLYFCFHTFLSPFALRSGHFLLLFQCFVICYLFYRAMVTRKLPLNYNQEEITQENTQTGYNMTVA